jgi:hypothetical protein
MENTEAAKDKAINAVVGGLKTDFKIVGSHRVHSWYAWAIIGIVFGMALGVIYVANRTGRFQQSDASQGGRKGVVLACPSNVTYTSVGGIGKGSEFIDSGEKKEIEDATSADGKSIDLGKVSDEARVRMMSAINKAIADCRLDFKRFTPPSPITCAGSCGTPTVKYPNGAPANPENCEFKFFTITADSTSRDFPYLLTVTAATNPAKALVEYTCALPTSAPAQPATGGATGPGTPGGDNEGGVVTPTEKKITEPTTTKPSAPAPTKPIRR